jgi:hypothetical protein
MTRAEQQEQKRILWEERIAAFQTSGQTVSGWCRERDISEHQMRYWLRRILPKRAKTQESVSSHWVQVDSSGNTARSGISLCIGNVTLDVQPGFDQQVLVEVLRSLMSLC